MVSNEKIPKIIHYCWFGRNPLPPLALRCINSWKLKLPEYEIKQWNETNFNINCNIYVKQAYDNKKYAFVSDFARHYILYHFGGIYMDTDVEVLQPLDRFLTKDMFIGFERHDRVASGLILGSIEGTDLMLELMEGFNKRNFFNDEGKIQSTTIVEYTTEILKNRGLVLDGSLQEIDQITIYPMEYFCPINYDTGKCKITKNTYTIHHYAGTWLTLNQKLKLQLKRIIHDSGMEKLSKIKKFVLRGKNA